MDRRSLGTYRPGISSPGEGSRWARTGHAPGCTASVHGSSAIPHLHRGWTELFRVCGTPNEDVWPGVTSLQDWNESFPVWPALDILKLPGLANFDDAGVDLIDQLLPLDPKKRMSAGECLKHEYFSDMGMMNI